MPNVETKNADEFRGEDGIYRFPFKVLDETPGGSNLGRIEWNIELIGEGEGEEYRIGKLLVWARQTRDARYVGKVFEIPCQSMRFGGHRLSEKGSFTDAVWMVYLCPEHRAPVMSAYPENHHSEIEINAGSSVMIDVRFRWGPR